MKPGEVLAQQRHHAQFEFAAFAEVATHGRRCLAQEQGATPHAHAGVRRGVAEHHDGAGQHAVAQILAGVAADHQQAAAHAFAAARANVAVDHQHAAVHAACGAGREAAYGAAGRAADVDMATQHAHARAIAGVTADAEFSAAHLATELIADPAANLDKTFPHAVADPVTPAMQIHQTQVAGIVTAQLEQLTERALTAARRDTQTTQGSGREAAQRGGREHAEIQRAALVHELEGQRTHFNMVRSLKW